MGLTGHIQRLPSGGQLPDGITPFLTLFKALSPIFSFTMGLTGHTPSSRSQSSDVHSHMANLSARNIPESLNRHPNIPTTVPASSHDYAFLVPFAPPGFKLRRQGNLTSGGFLDGAHWAYTFHRSRKAVKRFAHAERRGAVVELYCSAETEHANVLNTVKTLSKVA